MVVITQIKCYGCPGRWTIFPWVSTLKTSNSEKYIKGYRFSWVFFEYERHYLTDDGFEELGI